MRKTKVLIRNSQSEVKIPTGIRMLIRRCCNAVLTSENFIGDAEISVSFVNNSEIQKLNALYRDKDVPTDVLSFPLGENGVYDRNTETGAYIIGDVVISLEKSAEQARHYGHSLQRELAFLTVHSMLHLLGYHHENSEQQRVRMREKEETILHNIGLPRDSKHVMLDE